MGIGEVQIDNEDVDDNPLMTRLLAELLGDEGYRVMTLGGANVFETVLSHAPRLIMLDVLMPEVDGAAICQRLRADPRTAQMPIIFISALPAVTLQLRLQGCPYGALITKPFGLGEVIRTVARCLPIN